MFNLQSLRNANRLTRFLLVWLVLFVGSAVASPLVKPEAVHLVCTAIGGVKLVQLDAAGADVDSAASHTALDCPACLPLIAPPVADVLAPLTTSYRLCQLPGWPVCWASPGKLAHPLSFWPETPPLKRLGAESVSASTSVCAPRSMGFAVCTVCASSSVR